MQTPTREVIKSSLDIKPFLITCVYIFFDIHEQYFSILEIICVQNNLYNVEWDAKHYFLTIYCQNIIGI